MFNFKPENLCGDTNKLLFAILTELKQLNESVQSLHQIANDVVIKLEKVELIKKPKKEVAKNGSKCPGKSTVGATSKRSKPDSDRSKRPIGE